jgi:hypothetical protein
MGFLQCYPAVWLIAGVADIVLDSFAEQFFVDERDLAEEPSATVEAPKPLRRQNCRRGVPPETAAEAVSTEEESSGVVRSFNADGGGPDAVLVAGDSESDARQDGMRSVVHSSTSSVQEGTEKCEGGQRDCGGEGNDGEAQGRQRERERGRALDRDGDARPQKIPRSQHREACTTAGLRWDCVEAAGALGLG